MVEGYGNPIVDGLIPASADGAPTVVAYGHYDVQAPGPSDLWQSDPFQPEVRDGWLYARGASDDKGNFYALLRGALDLAAEGNLPVNVRVLADGEEEIGGHSVLDYLETIEERLDAAVIFDGGMADAETPAITNGLRGVIGFQLKITSADKELHSGLYGGVAADAVRDLISVLSAVIGTPDSLAAGVSAALRHRARRLEDAPLRRRDAGRRRRPAGRRVGGRRVLPAHRCAPLADGAFRRRGRPHAAQDLDQPLRTGVPVAAAGARPGPGAHGRRAGAAAALGLPRLMPSSS